MKLGQVQLLVAAWGAIVAGLSGCADATQLATLNPAGASVRRVVPAGAQDTLVLSDSVSLAVDNSGASSTVDIEVAPLGNSKVVPASMDRGGAIVHVRPSANTEPGAQAAAMRDPVSTKVTLLMTTAPPASDVARNIAVRSAGDATADVLWTVGNTTTVVDAHTGQSHTVTYVDLAPPIGEDTDDILEVVDASSACDLPPRLIDVSGGMADPEAIPLVLIHGWQPKMVACHLPVPLPLISSYEDWDQASNVDPFGDLIPAVEADSALAHRYHMYVMHYPTFAPVTSAAQFLETALAGLGQPAVIVAHSMGGLVARAAMGFSGAPAVRGLITVGTPHQGAPDADIVKGLSYPTLGQLASLAGSCPSVEATLVTLGIFGKVLTPFLGTQGFYDLSPSSTLIQFLESNRAQQAQIFTIGGHVTGSIISDPEFHFLGCLTDALSGGAASDGVSPAASALPTWSAGQQLIDGEDHDQLMHSSTVISKIDDVLSRWAGCDVSIPPPLATLPFPVSGSVGREPDGSVDVTLNGIVVNGAVQTGLTKDNFGIVENGCALPASQFDVTTGIGHVGADVVFIQDLSSSMDGPIASVRNTVTAFASNLAAQGLDVRFGSVGYSGPGTVPSTPAGSRAEFLGPIEDLTDATTFRNFVATQWISVGGGDVPENGLEAIEYAMDHISWRAGAARILIDITNSGHHTASDNCDDDGPCTDQTLASISQLLAGRAVVHVVAPADVASRTQNGSLDPWALATVTGGQQIQLGNGNFDLTQIGVTDAIAATTRLTFRSASSTSAPENLRVRVTINGLTSELQAGLITYQVVPPELQHSDVHPIRP